jgi:hypothetical protein
MFRYTAIVALLLSTSFGQADNKKKAEPETAQPQVEVSRPSPIRFGGFWLGGGGAYAEGRDLNPAYRLYRPCCWHDPWYDVFSPVGVFENCFAYPGLCQVFARGEAVETGVIVLKTQPDAEVFIDGGYAGQARDLEKMKLPPGIYTLRVEEQGFEPFERKIYLLSGKKVKISAALTALEVKP